MPVVGTAADALYTWWVHPVAVNDPPFTWVGGVGAGTTGVAAQLNTVQRIHGGTGAVDVAVLDGTTAPDDHNCVAIALDPAQPTLMVFYARHNHESFTRWQYVDRTNLAKGPLQTLDFGGDVTYGQVLRAGDTLHLIVRNATDSQWQYRTTTDWGVTWSAVKVLFDFAGLDSMYLAARPRAGNETVADVLFSPHPPNTTHKRVYYASIDVATGAVRDVTGATVGDMGSAGGPALVPADLSLVLDLTSSTERARTLDVGLLDGRPAIAYAIWDGEEPATPTTTVYRVRRWTGGVWTDGDWELTSGVKFGYLLNRQYLGGVAIGRSNDIWTSREAAGTWHVERWQRSGDGFTLAEEIDSSTAKLIRPYLVAGASSGPAEIVYQRVSFYDSARTTNYVGGTVVWALPSAVAAPPPVAVAQIRRRITWLGVHAVTGRIIAELPDVRGSVGRLLSAYSSHELTMPLPLAGPGHVPIQLVEQATAPITSAIVAVVNDLPVWMGWVLARRGGTGPELRLATVTPEGYLRRRRVRAHTFVGVDRAVVAQTLIGDAGDLTGVGSGLGFTLDVQATGDLISPVYIATDRTTVYDALRELAAGGLEFTVDLDWTDGNKNTVRKIIRLAARIGQTGNGLAPLFETTASSVFESVAGSEATYDLMEDYTSDRYGNHVVAVAPGEGEDQPASVPAVDQGALDGGAPVVEHLLELSSAATSQAALDAAAAAELARLRHGGQVWDIAARLGVYPRLGVDAQLGDDVQWQLRGHRHPSGVVGSGRMVGYEVDEQAGLWRPILLDPQGQVVS